MSRGNIPREERERRMGEMLDRLKRRQRIDQAWVSSAYGIGHRAARYQIARVRAAFRRLPTTPIDVELAAQMVATDPVLDATQRGARG